MGVHHGEVWSYPACESRPDSVEYASNRNDRTQNGCATVASGPDAEHRRYAEALERDLASVVMRTQAMPVVRRVILFGSYTRGQRDLFTDPDALVVKDSFVDFVTRCTDLARRIRAEVALDSLA